VQSADLALALAAGLVAALNPCGFAMLPAYLALVVRDTETSRSSALGRALLATVFMALGFVAVFAGFGLLTTAAGSTVQRHLPWVTLAVGVVLAALGCWLLAGRELSGWIPLTSNALRAPTARLGSMFGYGVGYAVASLSCTIGPFLAVTGIGFAGSSGGFGAFLAYAAGFTLIVGTLAAAAALAGTALVTRLRAVLPYVNRVSGAILLVVGAYVGYYGWYELGLRSATGDPSDPLINGAARIQGALAGWVYGHGAWPWVGALAVVTAVAVVWARRSTRDPRAAGSSGTGLR
jgi:cytochrome c biogenesis protein CcdA